MLKETSTAFARKTAADAREFLASRVHPERLSIWFLQYSRLTSLVKQLSKKVIILAKTFKFYLTLSLGLTRLGSLLFLILDFEPLFK